MEKFSSVLSIFIDVQCYRVLAENKITIEVKIKITIQYALLTPNYIKPHDEIPMLINVTTLFIQFFSFISYLFRSVLQNFAKVIRTYL